MITTDKKRLGGSVNAFLIGQYPDYEFRFNLSATFDPDSCLVALGMIPDKRMLFHDHYPYRSSMSNTMREHFKRVAEQIKKEFSPKRVMEVGSNDGIFIKNFTPEEVVAVEPCGNFAKITQELGYTTYSEFWDEPLKDKMLTEQGKFDVVYSANCMCHISRLYQAFKSVQEVLNDDGVFIFEDPSLLEMLKLGSYEQIYDEHAYLFCAHSMKVFLDRAGMKIHKIEKVNTHGGSNRFYAVKKESQKLKEDVDGSVADAIFEERDFGITKYVTYVSFAAGVRRNKRQLVHLLIALKKGKKNVVGYGATSKSTVVYNYCNIGKSLVPYIIDTTPEKQGKYSPGKSIPIVSPEQLKEKEIVPDYYLLSAWNFREEIFKKEKDFLDRGGKFIEYIPEIRIIGKEDL